MPKVTQTRQKTNLLSVLLFCACSLLSITAQAQYSIKKQGELHTGAERLDQYLHLVKGKRVAIVANHTSLIGSVHLVDTLKSLGVDIRKVFSPEHGFRGEAGAGEKVASTTDPRTGIALVSLYGKNKKPTDEQLADIDVVIYDIQDVGARFYTYISTMTYVMDACAKKKIKFIVLDRPNPNGHYIDGPVLEKEYASFVGLHPVPVVYGMTAGEYACMVSEEGWLESGLKCDLTVITCTGYDHRTLYQLPVKPSPNLPTMESVYLYPTLCFFEGTVFSMGRGTDKPFQVAGHPDYLRSAPYTFTPQSNSANKSPKHEGQKCYGYDLTDEGKTYYTEGGWVQLTTLITCYQNFGDKAHFFTSYFNTLAGNSKLQEQIKAGIEQDVIRDSWQPGLQAFRQIRKKYLLYKDFE